MKGGKGLAKEPLEHKVNGNVPYSRDGSLIKHMG